MSPQDVRWLVVILAISFYGVMAAVYASDTERQLDRLEEQIGNLETPE